jgi:glycosyltransferase involved in cell wall biosynthesis
MMPSDKIEVFIPTYNRSKLLHKTLEQLLDGPLKECRITVVDDGCTDETERVTTDFARSHSNVIYVKHRINLGLVAAYFKCIDLMGSCQYTWILADDDDLDFSAAEDVMAEVDRGDSDLISVSADCHSLRMPGFRGHLGSAAHLRGFMKSHSFTPSLIFKSSLFTSEIVKDSYHYGFFLPQVIFLVRLIEALGDELSLYCSKKTVITQGRNRGYESYLYYQSWERVVEACKQGWLRDVIRNEHTNAEINTLRFGGFVLDTLHFPKWLHQLLTGRVTDIGR